MTRMYRPLGLGYANLGALLMAKGLPYDSDEGRNYAGAITALMTGEAYAQSSRIAGVKGAFEGWEADKEAMHSVIAQHWEHLPIPMSVRGLTDASLFNVR
jgi:ribonucleoside-diphosphate reductase alpha chain